MNSLPDRTPVAVAIPTICKQQCGVPDPTEIRPAWAQHLPAGLAVADVDLVGAGNLTRRWVARWETDPTAPVVFDEDGGWVTGDELEARTRRIADRLNAAGLVAGDRVLMSAQASIDLVVAHIAALRLGLVVAPVNTAYREREVAHVVADAGPRAAVVDDSERAGWIVAASGANPVLVVGPEVDLPDGPGAALDNSALDDPAVLLYTSGTTGLPKGAPLSHRNLLASAQAVVLAWRWTPADRLVLALPLFHLHGLGVGLHGALCAGASVVLRPGFAADDLFDVSQTHQASLFFGVPTMYARLAQSARLSELARLRLCVSGSAPLPADLHAAIEERGGQRIVERYGMTETVMNVSNPYDGDRVPGTVGLALPGVDLRLDDGTDEILVRGPNVFSGYWRRPEATTESFTDGWFRTGDVGAFDSNGYLKIVGRRKELIISGGYNVYPREVEDVLRTHPGVGDVAVIGVADPVWGEAVIAFVEGGDPASGLEAALITFAADQLAPYKRPKRVHQVDRLPRNALGKVIKAELHE